MKDFDIFEYYLKTNNYVLVNQVKGNEHVDDGDFMYDKIDDSHICNLHYYLGGYYLHRGNKCKDIKGEKITEITQLLDNNLIKFNLYKYMNVEECLWECSLLRVLTEDQVDIISVMTDDMHDLSDSIVEDALKLKDTDNAINFFTP